MRLEFYHVDAFASGVFRGNPAAVVPVEEWPGEGTMQAIAAENNLSETAFVMPRRGGDDPPAYEIRWFTPRSEVDLCGHATLAAAHVLFSGSGFAPAGVRFQTRQAGELAVTREGDRLSLDFPARPGRRLQDGGLVRQVEGALGTRIRELRRSRDLMAVVGDAETVRSLQPDFTKLAAIDAFAVMITAPGSDCDFVSRFFAPREGIPEDPVTGSAHCTLIPYWAHALQKSALFARQLSPRGGELWCRLGGGEGANQRVHIAGHAVTYLQGHIEVPLG